MCGYGRWLCLKDPRAYRRKARSARLVGETNDGRITPMACCIDKFTQTEFMLRKENTIGLCIKT